MLIKLLSHVKHGFTLNTLIQLMLTTAYETQGIIFIFQMRVPRHREVWWLTQGYTAVKWHSQESIQPI